MNSCNYVPFLTDPIDPLGPDFDDIFDLDILCTEEGILINLPEE